MGWLTLCVSPQASIQSDPFTLTQVTNFSLWFIRNNTCTCCLEERPALYPRNLSAIKNEPEKSTALIRKQWLVLTVCFPRALPVSGSVCASCRTCASGTLPVKSSSARRAARQAEPAHWPDLSALDSLPAGRRVVHSVDGTNGPGLNPPLVLAAFSVARHRLVHLRTGTQPQKHRNMHLRTNLNILSHTHAKCTHDSNKPTSIRIIYRAVKKLWFNYYQKDKSWAITTGTGTLVYSQFYCDNTMTFLWEPCWEFLHYVFLIIHSVCFILRCSFMNTMKLHAIKRVKS